MWLEGQTVPKPRPLRAASPRKFPNPTSPTPKSPWILSSTQNNNNADDVVSTFTPGWDQLQLAHCKSLYKRKQITTV